MEEFLVGRKDIEELFQHKIKQLISNRGGLVLISGDSGYGKTYLMEYFNSYIDEQNKNPNRNKELEPELYNMLIACHAPVGKMSIGSMQPLNTISLIVKELMEDKTISLEKKLAMSVGMTLLACIPIGGEIPYAFKEIKRDLKKYQEDKMRDKGKVRSSAFDEYMKYIKTYAEKRKIVVFIDDLHWADADTIDFIWELKSAMKDLPILIIATYKENDLQSLGLPILSLIKKNEESSDKEFYKNISLSPFTKDDIYLASKKIYFKNYQRNEEFENWIYEHSMGVPSVIADYLEYFSKYSPFGPTGALATNFKDNEFLPASIQQLFGQKLDDITDEDKNILSLCSAEGREFTALIVAQLMNTDILTTIKKLRSIQNNTNIIKSIGAKFRYGLKTTVYQFTQAYYHSYFENKLEYEEKVALHSQISGYLKQRYDSASEEIKELLAPYLAAHSSEAGDGEMMEEMLIETAKTAKDYGSSEIIMQTYSNYEVFAEDVSNLSDSNFMTVLKNMAEDVELKDLVVKNMSTNDKADPLYVNKFINLTDFNTARNSIINNHISKNYALAVAQADAILNDDNFNLDEFQIIQLMNFKANALLEMKEYSQAEKILNTALMDAKKGKNPESECLTLNVLASYYLKIDNSSKAIELLEAAGNIALQVKNELQLITISNIAMVLKNLSPVKARTYLTAAVKQCDELGFKDLAEELKLNFN